MSAPPAAQPAPPPVDLITALQEQLARLNAMLFNYIGALQRDAPPQSLKGEALVAAPKTYDMPAQADLMASDLVAGLSDVERLIQQLPEVGSSEAEDVAQAVRLLRQNADAAQELQQELATATAKLAQLQDAHGALAEAALARKAAAAAAAAGAAAGAGAPAGAGTGHKPS